MWVVFGLGLPLYLALTLLASRLYYTWIEQPSNRRGKTVPAALSPARPGAAAEA
jgi:peptidoglycan/LPS O-acetylase OafA/YrhL